MNAGRWCACVLCFAVIAFIWFFPVQRSELNAPPLPWFPWRAVLVSLISLGVCFFSIPAKRHVKWLVVIGVVALIVTTRPFLR